MEDIAMLMVTNAVLEQKTFYSMEGPIRPTETTVLKLETIGKMENTHTELETTDTSHTVQPGGIIQKFNV